MCGIFCMIFGDVCKYEQFYYNHIKNLLQNRGPNRSRTVCQNSIFYAATILWHQGSEICNQPLEFDNTILLFNGDLYMDEIINDASDTQYLFQLINKARDEDEFLDIFKSITGPFSIICYFKSKLYVLRDSLGRNSLIVGKYDDMLFFTSVMEANEAVKAMELPPLGIYVVDIENKHIKLFPYETITHDHTIQQVEQLRIIHNSFEVSDRLINPQWLKLHQKISFNFSFEELFHNSFENLLHNSEVTEACDKFIELLSKSILDRIKKTQKFCKECLYSSNCHHSNVGILFSGGVDCSILTILADKFIDKSKPIDLMNVAFEKAKNTATEINWNVPDRLTGLETLKELQELCPNRKFNFIKINIDRNELQNHADKLRSLVFPLKNVLDESLGAALYFASRGKGLVDENSYQSNCRVILMGSGADELFGGYTRHRNAFKRGGSEALKQELEDDWIKLPTRNLARDDRVIGNNGITVRAPYVEEKFVNFARNLKSLQRCHPSLEEGVGDKLLLRLSAYKLGLIKCCKLRKRALQFGSRIADSRQNAKDKSNFLNHMN